MFKIGTLLLPAMLSLAVLPGASIAASLKPGAQLATGTISFPSGFMPSVKSFGAIGDGKHDDTAAIQAALSQGRPSATGDYFSKPKGLYFPPGVYLVHDTLKWNGCCVTLQGAGPGATTIRLAPKSAGFGNGASPKPLILTPEGEESFHQEIWDLKLEIGAGNPGATALNYVSNNMGSVSDVSIVSDDGQGYDGIDLTRQYAGPLMIRNTEIQGFERGIDTANSEYSSTLENITLTGQNVVGINNVRQTIEIHNLSSVNSVPALINTSGFVVLLDATLTGGSAGRYAMQTNSAMYLRDISVGGYGATLLDTSVKPALKKTGSIGEHLVGASQNLTGKTSGTSLNLNIEETPVYTGSNLDSAPVIAKSFGDMSGLLPAFSKGKSMVYFPFGSYFSKNEVEVVVPDTVTRIVGFSSVVFGNSEGYNGGSIRFVISSNSTTPLIVEQITGVKIDHRGSRPVVIKDSELSYTTVPGAGNLYVDDVMIKTELSVQPNQHVWARQLDDEIDGEKIENKGGSLWILGMKTENSDVVIDTTDGGKTELLGGLIYPAHPVPSTDVAFRSEDSQVSYMYSESVYCKGCGYPTQVEEIRDGLTYKITSAASSAYRMPLFVGFQ